MIFVASIDTIIKMLKEESLVNESIISEIKTEIDIKIKKEKEQLLDEHFITLTPEKDLVSVLIHKRTDKTGRLIDSFKVTPDKIIENILYNISDNHKKYLENEIKKIKSGGKYVQE